jgi:hypothetical protein
VTPAADETVEGVVRRPLHAPAFRAAALARGPVSGVELVVTSVPASCNPQPHRLSGGPPSNR